MSALGGGASNSLGSALQHDMPSSPPPHDPNERASFDALSSTPVEDGQNGRHPNGAPGPSSQEGGMGMGARGSGSIDGRQAQEEGGGGSGGGGFAPTANGGRSGGGGELSRTSTRPQDNGGGGEGGGGDGPNADGETEVRKRLRMEELLHSAGGNDS